MYPVAFNQAMSGGFGAPPITGAPIMAGLPGGSSMMLQMLLESLLPKLMGGQMIPGQFFPQQNLHNTLYQRMLLQQQQMAIQVGAQADIANAAGVMRGAAYAAGMPWSSDQQAQALSSARRVMFAAPMMAMMGTDVSDAVGFHGTGMAYRMFGGGRFAVDPMTGLMGMSPGMAGMTAGMTAARLYGPGADPFAMRGFGGGAVGQMYESLTLAGMGPAPVGGRFGQLTPWGPMNQMAVAHVQSQATANWARSWVGPMSAMRDIMGPNATPEMRIRGMNALMQDGTRSMTPQQIESQLRTFEASASVAGLSLEEAIRQSSEMGPLLRLRGKDPRLALELTSQAAIFTRSSLATSQGVTATGMPSAGRLAELVMHRTANAAASPEANLLAVTRKLHDAGALKGEAKLMAEALDLGHDFYTTADGRKKSVFTSEAQWADLMDKSGVDQGLRTAWALQTAGNEKFISPEVVSIVRKHQAVQTRRAIRQNITPFMNLPPGMRQHSAAMAAAWSNAVMADPRVAGDQQAQIEVLRAEGKRLGLNLTDAQLKIMAVSAFDTADQFTRTTLNQTLMEVVSADNKKAHDMTASNTVRADLIKRGNIAMDPFNRDPLMGRITSALREMKPGDSLSDTIAKIAGGSKVADIEKNLLPDLKKAMALQDKIQAAGTPEEQKRYLDELSQMLPGLRKRAEKMGMMQGSRVIPFTGGQTLDAFTAAAAASSGKTASPQAATSDVFTQLVEYLKQFIEMLKSGQIGIKLENQDAKLAAQNAP